MNSTQSSTENPLEYVRLHITPLNPSILPSILPASLLPKARNISYHLIPTFPEKAYGFVELPIMEAEKLKKKLNGAILKGTKVQIEEARPKKQSHNEEETEAPSKPSKEKTSKKRRRDTETVPAVELRDRKVKRGWTDPDAPARSEKKKGKKDKKDKKEAVRSKYTSGPECLFRTTLPANSAGAEGVPSDSTKDRKKKGKGKEAVIHEFSKTVKHATFLRDNTISSASKGTAEYVEGQGWVNQDGEVIEAPVERKKMTTKIVSQEESESMDSDASSEIEEDQSEDESLAEKEAALSAVQEKTVKIPEVKDDSTSSSGASSDDDSDIESDSTSDSTSKKDVSPTPETPDEASRPVSSSGAPIGLTISIPTSTNISEQKPKVHPLEALYKRRKPDSELPRVNETPPSFSFFGPDNDEDDGGRPSFVIPMTPFTQQDFAHRGQRSAAPTPDTAHPSRLSQIKWPLGKDHHEADTEEADYHNTPSSKKQDSKTAVAEASGDNVSGFDKLFYEQRGEHNRGWKKQAKTVAKEKRNSENRKRRDRAI